MWIWDMVFPEHHVRQVKRRGPLQQPGIQRQPIFRGQAVSPERLAGQLFGFSSAYSKNHSQRV